MKGDWGGGEQDQRFGIRERIVDNELFLSKLLL